MRYKVSRKAFYLEGKQGKLFALYVYPAGILPPESIMHISAFSDEMNKCRHLASVAAYKIAQQGIGVLFIDLYGTGDSEGEWDDVTWDGWLDDIKMGHEWLCDNIGGDISAWGIRSGCLQIVDFCDKYKITLKRVIYWQPVISGNLFLTQFLRMKMAADFIADGHKQTPKILRESLQRNESVEVAGYILNPDIALNLENKVLNNGQTVPAPHVYWIETVTDYNNKLSAQSQKAIDTYKDILEIHTMIIQGEQYWVAPDIAMLPRLIVATYSIFKNN